MKYMLFFTGLCSTPNSVGLKCITTNEVICEIETILPSGKATRVKYNKMMGLLKVKYSNLITQ